jgi:hypothetical protein
VQLTLIDSLKEMAGNGGSKRTQVVNKTLIARVESEMKSEPLATVEDTSALTTSVLKTGRCLAANCGQDVWIADNSDSLWLLLNVLNLNLLVLLLLLRLDGCLLSSCLLLSLLLSCRLLLGLLVSCGLLSCVLLSLRLLLLDDSGRFVRDDGGVWRVGVETSVHQSIVCIQFGFRCKALAAR